MAHSYHPRFRRRASVSFSPHQNDAWDCHQFHSFLELKTQDTSNTCAENFTFLLLCVHFLLWVLWYNWILITWLFFQDCVSNIMKHARECNVPMVIDGVCDGWHCYIASWFSDIPYGVTLDTTSGGVLCFIYQDGLYLVTNCLDLVSGYPLAVLTPNLNEYKRLVQKVLNSEVNDENGTDQLLSLAKGWAS